MKLIHDYMKNDKLRHELNALAGKTFGLDFESWVTEGYFEGDYIPYSFEEGGKIISNVSANRMCFVQNGVKKNYIQIGTVMTDEAYRKRGLAKKLMEHVMERYRDQCDGIYLFANLDALDFYRRLGFAEGREYSYTLKPEFCHPKLLEDVFLPVGQDEGMKRKYMEMVRHSAVNSSMEQVNKFGLQMFYTAGMDDVYYARDLDCFLVARMEGDTLLLQSIVCREAVSLKDILTRIDREYRNCRLGFAPGKEDAALCRAELYDGGEDYRFFYLGSELESIEKQKLFFPEFSHA